MSSEDLNLPASLERLEINPARQECSGKTEENPFSFGTSCPLGNSPECSLETLSLKAICPKGNCLCNKKKDGIGRHNVNNSNMGGTNSLKSITHNRRPLLRRSKLSREVLRAPILKLGANEIGSDGNNIGQTSTTYKTKDVNKAPNNNNDQPTSLYSAPSTSSSSVSMLHPPAAAVVNNHTGAATAIIHPRPNYLTSAATSSHCCALQARSINNNSASTSSVVTPDDTNIDELASYFDLFVHIPKKMSVMAEMMYI